MSRAPRVLRGPRITVLVADEQRLFAEALGCALPHHGLTVLPEHPPSGRDVVQAVMTHRPDVVLLDFWMPGMNGPAVTRAVQAWSPGPKMLLLSWLHGPRQVQEALAAGACGFLPKSLTLEKVAEAVRRAHAGEDLVFAEQVARLVDGIVRRGEESDERWRRLMTLSPREVEILYHLNRGLPAKQLAQQLSISVGTLRNHIHNVLKKTGARSQLEAINMARHEGLISDVGPPPTPPLPTAD